MKKFLYVCIFLVAVVCINTIYASANDAVSVLFEHRTTEQISRGITFEQSRMMTERGMLDVSLLIIDMHEPYIRLAPVTSPVELGQRETTSHMLREAGAIAGINADFFGTAGTHSVHFGPLARDGVLLASNPNTNHSANQFATFFVGAHNNPFFRYIQTGVRFYSNNVSHFSIAAYNTIGHYLDFPAVVSRSAMQDTSLLTRRFDGLVKVVSNGSSITQITSPGQTVEIPQNGYVLVLPARFAYRTRYFDIGDTTRLELTNNANINFSGIQTAIGGGGLILAGGQIVNDDGTVPAGRHPRSAVGVSQDGRRVILMTVDGRNHSIGANHVEMAFLLRRAGAFDAMHFDGGGSTTMVTSSRGYNHVVANTVSDGAERRVINALGVFDRSPVGSISRIVIETDVDRAIVGIPVLANVFGEDVFGNRITANAQSLVFSANDPTAGTWNGAVYTPTRTGAHYLRVQYGTRYATRRILVYELAEIQPQRNSVSLFTGQRAVLGFTGLTTCGITVPIVALDSLRVSSSALGYFDGFEFVAAGWGAGYIAARIAGVSAYIPLSINGFPQAVNMFASVIMPMGVPEGVFAHTFVVDAGAGQAIRLHYMFARDTRTQAAYAVFNTPLALPGTPVGLSLRVYGDGSGHWLRARVQDANGDNHLIDFTRSADFEGWETLIARLPNAPAPFTLDQIYAVATNWYELTYHQLIFYNLQALYAPTDVVQLPQSTRFVDAWHAPVGFVGANDSRDSTFVLVNSPETAEPMRYSAFAHGDFAVLSMTARGGGFFAADSSQWQNFTRDIRALNQPNVLIMVDSNPLLFSQRMEFELFHLALQDLREEGHNVFVMSANAPIGGETALTMRDGIRYINKPRTESGVATIRFWVESSGRVWWR